MTPTTTHRRCDDGAAAALARDAVTVGAGSMIGAGVFSAWGPAADAAGTGLLIGLVVAAAVAFCNATSSAQLAAVHPESGGTYVYARRQLGPLWGYLAGWGFVVGKTASCVAIALTAGAYLWPDHARLVGVAAVGGRGDRQHRRADPDRRRHQVPARRGARRARRRSSSPAGRARPARSRGSPRSTPRRPASCAPAGFLFFAFAGYARIATLGEEVRDPATHHPQGDPARPGRRAGRSTPSSVSRCSPPFPSTPSLRATHRSASSSARPASTGSRPSSGSAPASPPSACSSTSSPACPARCSPWPVAASSRTGSRRSTTAARCPCAPRPPSRPSSSCSPPTLDLRGAIGFSGVTILTYYAITNAACLTLSERSTPLARVDRASPDSPAASPSP